MTNLEKAKSSIDSLMNDTKKFFKAKEEIPENPFLLISEKKVEDNNFLQLYNIEYMKNSRLNNNEANFIIILENESFSIKKVSKNHTKILGGLYFSTKKDADTFLYNYKNINNKL